MRSLARLKVAGKGGALNRLEGWRTSAASLNTVLLVGGAVTGHATAPLHRPAPGQLNRRLARVMAAQITRSLRRGAGCDPGRRRLGLPLEGVRRIADRHPAASVGT